MTIETQFVKQLLNKDVYSCELVNRRMGYMFFNDGVNPIGNIINFVYPTQIGPLSFNEALVIVTELNNVDMFGGVCFQRLYTTQLGSILNELLDKEVFIDNSAIFIENKQANVVITNRVKQTVTSHIIFPLNTGEQTAFGFYDLDLKDNKEKFLQQSIEAFEQLRQSIFIETQRDNF